MLAALARMPAPMRLRAAQELGVTLRRDASGVVATVGKLTARGHDAASAIAALAKAAARADSRAAWLDAIAADS